MIYHLWITSWVSVQEGYKRAKKGRKLTPRPQRLVLHPIAVGCTSRLTCACTSLLSEAKEWQDSHNILEYCTPLIATVACSPEHFWAGLFCEIGWSLCMCLFYCWYLESYKQLWPCFAYTKHNNHYLRPLPPSLFAWTKYFWSLWVHRSSATIQRLGLGFRHSSAQSESRDYCLESERCISDTGFLLPIRGAGSSNRLLPSSLVVAR